MQSTPERFSPRLLARIWGGIGLFGIAAGFFDIGYVHSHVVVSGDAGATARNLIAHAALYRFGIALHLLMVLLNALAEVIGFYLFRRVNPLLATMALACGLVGAAVESLDLLGSILPLQLGGGTALAGFSATQLHDLSYLSLRLQEAGLLISFLFWGLEEVLTGYLIFRCGFLPRTLGALLALSGFLYLSDPLLSFAAPSLAGVIFPGALGLCLPGELLSALWMATRSVDLGRWREWGERAGIGQPA